jgi:hypothetical protein
MEPDKPTTAQILKELRAHFQEISPDIISYPEIEIIRDKLRDQLLEKLTALGLEMKLKEQNRIIDCILEKE